MIEQIGNVVLVAWKCVVDSGGKFCFVRKQNLKMTEHAQYSKSDALTG